MTCGKTSPASCAEVAEEQNPYANMEKNRQNSISTFSDSSSNNLEQYPDKEARRAARRETRKQKDRFLIFTRVLVKYLEQADPELHTQVREIIRDCTERKSRKEPGYESVTSVLRTRIREVVSDQYWNRAEMYLEQFMKEKAMMAAYRQRRGSMSSRRGSMSSRHTVDTTETESSSLASLPEQSELSYQSGTMNPLRRAEKDNFVIFMRVLVGYLQEVDPDMHTHVKDMIQDCAARNKRHEPGFESVTGSVRERLLIVVPREHWEQAQIRYEAFLREKATRSMGFRACRRSSI